MFTDRDVENAARYLLREHGEDAVWHAESHASNRRRQGSDDIAEVWQQVAQRLCADLSVD